MADLARLRSQIDNVRNCLDAEMLPEALDATAGLTAIVDQAEAAERANGNSPSQNGSAPPPQNLEAEESILGAMMIAPAVVPAVQQVLAPQDFYRHSHAVIYQAGLELWASGNPVDSITLAAFLEQMGQLDAAGGKGRLQELAGIVPATANAAHYARIVHEMALLRSLVRAGQEIARLGWEQPGTTDVLLGQAEAIVAELGKSRAVATEPLQGLTHAEAMQEDLSLLSGGQLVAELVERGTVGTIAGIPETHKTWLAQQIATGVAQGAGTILGQQVLEQGPVGYFWQDDSRRNELERIQTQALARSLPHDLPLRWFLNEGLTLPGDLARLRATIEAHGLVLAVLDSFYNVAGGLDLKDRGAGELVAALKAQVCDPTGCTITIVDHAPWPTDSNRGQMRAYGDVHKGAAVRWGIYLTRERSKLYIEARGNNVRGFKRTGATWDEERLELHLIEETPDVTPEEYDERLLAYLAEHPWASSRDCDTGPEGRASELRKARRRLEANGTIRAGTSTDAGKTGSGKYWTTDDADESLFVA